MPNLPIHIRSYSWFLLGFQTISILFAIANFGMLFITMLTVKGIYFPMWAVAISSGILVIMCVVTGYALIHYSIQQRAQSYTNMNVNPEFQILLKGMRDIEAIKKHLGLPDD